MVRGMVLGLHEFPREKAKEDVENDSIVFVQDHLAESKIVEHVRAWSGWMKLLRSLFSSPLHL